MEQEIRNLLAEFNGREHLGETLNADVWCKRIVVSLKQESTQDAQSDLKNALAQLKSQAVSETSESDEIKIGQFLSFWLEHNCLTLASDLKASFDRLAECQSRADVIQALNEILDKLKRLKIETRRSCEFDEMITPRLDAEQMLESYNEMFEKILQQNCDLETFKRNFNGICGHSGISDIQVGKLMVEIEMLSPGLSPVVITKELRNVLTVTKLMPYLFCKITVTKLTEITDTDASQPLAEHCAWNMLRGLVACNYEYKARNEADITSKSVKERRMMRARTNLLHPMDILYASFLCCDEEAKQFLCQRLFTCKIAFPFFYVNEINKLVQSDWILRDICLNYINEKGDPVEINLGNHTTLPVVSFLRFGKQPVSKSNLLNHILYSKSSHDTFFHRSCDGGRGQRDCTDGLVEAAVFLSTKESRSPAFFALNLRGDMRQHGEQTDKLIKISDCCVLLVGAETLKEKDTLELLQKIQTDVPSLTLVVCIDENMPSEDIDNLENHCTQEIEPFGIHVIMGDCSEVEISKEVFQYIVHDIQGANIFKIHSPCNAVPKHSYVEAAASLCRKVFSQQSNFKEVAFPLQGESWCELSKLERELANPKSHGGDLEVKQKQNQIITIRRKQLSDFVDGNSTKQFLDNLQHFKTESDQRIFLQELNLLLQDETRKHSMSATELDKGTVINLQTIFREIGLLYEAYTHLTLTDKSEYEYIRHLPSLFASLLLSGVPLELLDGSARNIPVKWITDVLTQCKKLTNDKKLFIVSVLGMQSTGKSTLLNTMFGLRLPVSAGRCTRGAFLQLVHVDENSGLPFDYLAVIDTEGLRAVERGSKTHEYDNKLATFVIGLADLTMITVLGEDSPEMREILQIVIYALIKMKCTDKKLDVRRKCLFVHQNVSDVNAMQKLEGEIHARQLQLDEITRVAAAELLEDAKNVTCFADIISFAEQQDTFLLPNPWEGNPPMAPMNFEFSSNVLRAKSRLIDISKDSERTLLTFSDFSLRIRDVWNAVLSEDFIFSFRNSIEMKAYRILDVECCRLKSEFNSAVKKYMENVIWNIKMLQTETTVEADCSKLSKDLQKEADNECKKVQMELKEFIKKSEYKAIMTQWESGKVTSLENSEQLLLLEFLGQLHELKILQILDIKCGQAVEKIRNTLQQKAQSLAKQPRDGGDDLKSIFDQIWTDEVESLSGDNKVDKMRLKEFFDKSLVDTLQCNSEELQKHLSKTAVSDPATEATLISDLTEVTDIPADQLYRVNDKKWLKIIPVIGTAAQNYLSGGTPEIVLSEVQWILDSTQSLLMQLKGNNRPLSATDAMKVVCQACNEFDKTAAHLKKVKINLLNPLKIAVAIYACRLAYKTFLETELQFLEQNSLRSKLEKQKSHLLGVFEKQAENCRKEVVASLELKNIIESALFEKIDREAVRVLKNYLETDNFIDKKYTLLKDILNQAIHENENCMLNRENLQFSLMESYIDDPKSAAFEFLKRRIDAILFQELPGHDRKYLDVIKTRLLNPAIEKLHDALKQTEDVTSVETWIEKFCLDSDMAMKKFNLIKICEEGELKDVKDLPALFANQITDGHQTVLKKIQDIEKDSDKPGIQALYQSVFGDLWGCDQTCPLCNEPCINMSADHVQTCDVQHSCLAHRPMGLTGAKLQDKNEFAAYTCNYFATSVSKMVQGTKRVFKAHKKFTCKKCPSRQSDCRMIGFVRHCSYKYKLYFPDWDIRPEYIAPVSDLWKFIAYSCKLSLKKKSEHYSNIPEEWKDVTAEMAMQSLEETFASCFD